jgi:hypothetical protein
MCDKQPRSFVSQDVLLRQPLDKLHVTRLVRHLLRLPLPQNLLFQFAKNTKECLSTLFSHQGCLQDGSQQKSTLEKLSWKWLLVHYLPKGDVDNPVLFSAVHELH